MPFKQDTCAATLFEPEPLPVLTGFEDPVRCDNCKSRWGRCWIDDRFLCVHCWRLEIQRLYRNG